MQGILLGLADVFEYLIYGFQVLLVVHWVLSLVGADPANPIVSLLRSLVEPVLSRLRKSLPFLAQGAWDLAPIAAWVICIFLNKALVFNLRVFAARF